MEDWAQTVRDQGDVMDTMSGNVSNRPLRSIRRGRARPGRSELVAKGRPVVNRLACATAVTPRPVGDKTAGPSSPGIARRRRRPGDRDGLPHKATPAYPFHHLVSDGVREVRTGRGPGSPEPDSEGFGKRRSTASCAKPSAWNRSRPRTHPTARPPRLGSVLEGQPVMGGSEAVSGAYGRRGPPGTCPGHTPPGRSRPQ